MPIRDKTLDVSKSAFLEEILNRLKDDVDPYFEKLKELNDSGKYPGNWAVVRMIMPVIEEVATTTELEITDHENDRVCKLLERLDIPYPNVVWDIYRNGLSHSERPFGLEYKGKSIIWSMSVDWDDPDEKNHSVSGQVIHINFKTLYEDFKIFIVEEQKDLGVKKPDPTLRIKIGKIYENYSGPLKDELEALVNPIT
jgi:hypothetical protein